MEKSGLYEVYICRYKDEVIYIGSGKIGRHKHTISGTSANYGLNKMHFENSVLDIEIKVFKDKKASLDYEKDQIYILRPKLNVIYNYKNYKRNELASEAVALKAKVLKSLMNLNLRNDRRNKLEAIVRELFKTFSIPALKEGVPFKYLIYNENRFLKSLATTHKLRSLKNNPDFRDFLVIDDKIKFDFERILNDQKD
jgi:hypothetical protein